jgi:hypothetical protein
MATMKLINDFGCFNSNKATVPNFNYICLHYIIIFKTTYPRNTKMQRTGQNTSKQNTRTSQTSTKYKPEFDSWMNYATL